MARRVRGLADHTQQAPVAVHAGGEREHLLHVLEGAEALVLVVLVETAPLPPLPPGGPERRR